MPRYELGDQLPDLSFDPSQPAPAPAPKSDHRAAWTVFDKSTGNSEFNVPTCDPATEEPLIELVVVFCPVGHAFPSTAADFLALSPDVYPRTGVAITPAEYGTTVILPRPAALAAGQVYLGQAIHAYAN